MIKQHISAHATTGYLTTGFKCICGRIISKAHLNKILTRDNKIVNTCVYCNNHITDKDIIK